MTTRDDIQQMIYSAIDEVNAAQSPDQQLSKRPDAILFGEGGSLDSLGLLTFVLQVEQRVQGAGHAAFTLTDEEAMAATPVAFRSVRSLTEFIAQRIGPG